MAKKKQGYPWKKWFDGKERVLTKGKHFKGKMASFVADVHRQSKRRNVDVDIAVKKKTVKVKANGAPAEERSEPAEPVVTSPVPVETSNVTEKPEPSGRSRVRYPYDVWFDGNEHVIVAGEDFTCKPESLRGNIRKQAKSRNVAVEVAILENGNVTVKTV